MKTIKVTSGYTAEGKNRKEEIYLIDSPIRNNWDLLTAIGGANNSIDDIIDHVYWWRSNTKNTEAKKAIGKVFDNLYDLILDYQKRERASEILTSSEN